MRREASPLAGLANRTFATDEFREQARSHKTAPTILAEQNPLLFPASLDDHADAPRVALSADLGD
ncbi:MAG TPA: hypothetical protein VIJ43_02845, partial [Burkholderiales bacterium]